MDTSKLQTRRDLLAGLAGLGAAAVLRGQGGNPRAIDCHHHFLSPNYIKTLAQRDGHHVQGYTTWFALDGLKNYTPAKDIEAMDREGVATSMLSCTTPGIWFGDPAETRRLARDMNEFGARAMSDYKSRFGLFALLPLPIIEDSLKEIEYAFDTLKADGVGLVSSYGNAWLGDPTFRPVFEELNRRKAIVYTHPIDAPCCQDIMPGVGPPTIEYNTDTARTIFSLIQGNAQNSPATRYADIRFIFSHGGGTMPSLVERFGIGPPDTIADVLARPAEPNSRLFHLRRFYYDCAQSTNPVQMQGLKTLAGASQIVLGSDYPFGSPGKHLTGVAKCGFSAEELRGIQRENALRILPRFKS
jgi:predicted TIM-barrel fold metal-dependent hydrolase